MKTTAFVLFSGGLDSTLIVKIFEQQKNLRLSILTFKSYFFTADKALGIAEHYHWPVEVVDISKEHFARVKNPDHGYGRGLNPCVDCKIVMLRKTKEIMEERGGNSFAVTGEVIGQRPMSQYKQALDLIERKSGLSGYLLRPLSAKLLPITEPEKRGWVDREKFFDFFGRSRNAQLNLAKQLSADKFLAPAGGCILTEKFFSQRLKEQLAQEIELSGNDLDILKVGRHFSLPNMTDKIVLGRDKEENKKLEKLAREGDILLTLKDEPGPTGLLRFYLPKQSKSREDALVEEAKRLILHYSPKAESRACRGVEPNQKADFSLLRL